MGEKVGGPSALGAQVHSSREGKPKPRDSPGQVPTASWNVTRAHECLPRAKLSAQLSSQWPGEGSDGGDLRGNVRGGCEQRKGTCSCKAREIMGSVQGTGGGGSQ